MGVATAPFHIRDATDRPRARFRQPERTVASCRAQRGVWAYPWAVKRCFYVDLLTCLRMWVESAKTDGDGGGSRFGYS